MIKEKAGLKKKIGENKTSKPERKSVRKIEVINKIKMTSNKS